jgi:hypothetical protein
MILIIQVSTRRLVDQADREARRLDQAAKDIHRDKRMTSMLIK